ncbi:MAG: DUF4342 domain-containing protein [Erysipelotrichaceae bacterium]|jgi:hypothetical protein|nr:DUF4342 domain-containing protein [Erysipelotrichaceae bacterium]MBQ2582299.1 DUF4342 domain-containing protein [Erysipelotrichaceae bacterium]
MNFSITEVDQVIQRTGCSYQEAKDALVKADGDVLDAIILLESRRSVFGDSRFKGFAEETERTTDSIVTRIKEIIAEGDASRFVVRDRYGKDITSISLNTTAAIGVVTLLAGAAPIVLISTLVARYGLNYRFVIVKSDGSEIIL